MDQVAEVKSKVDLVEVVSSYLPLKKTGRNFAALCPFHSEKTPSFFVSGERQAFKCFGCGEAGDVFTFLEKIEGWDFREVLEELAKKVGVKLTSYAPTARSKTRDTILAINELAAKFYAHLLNKHPIGERARKYLGARKIKRSLWEKFGLGYAPGGWEKTLDFFSKRGFALADLSQAGLVIARTSPQASAGQARKIDQGYYDRFRDRLIFPLKDSRGAVLGFSARVVEPETRNEPKYINTPETPVFNKGSLLFGLDMARSAIKEKNEAVLVEGEFDVLSAYQAGVLHVVASKGTALTEKQVAILGRLCEAVILCFDTDLAGDAAARRGIELLDLTGMSVKVVKLGRYKDPDDFVQKDPGGFVRAITDAANIYDYLIESARQRFDPKTAEGKKKIGKEIIPALAKISDDLVRAHYIEKLARILGLEVSLVAQAVEKRIPGLTSQSDRFEEEKEDTRNRVGRGEYFLALLFSQEEIPKEIFSLVSPADFENETAQGLWQWLRDIMKSSKRPKVTRRLLSKLPAEFSQFVDNLFLIDLGPIFADREVWAGELAKVARRIKQASLRRKLAAISLRLKVAQDRRNMQEVAILTKKFDEISARLAKEG